MMNRIIDTHTHINHGSKFDSLPDSLLYDAALDYLTKANEAAGFQKGRIEYALISDEDKENILWKNAKRLFGI